MLYLIYFPLSIEAAARAALDGDYGYYALTGFVFITMICCAVLAALNLHGSNIRMLEFNLHREKDGYECDYCGKGPVFKEDIYCRFCGKKFNEPPPCYG